MVSYYWSKETLSQDESSIQHREALMNQKSLIKVNPVTVQLNEHFKRNQEVARKALIVALVFWQDKD